jgi:prepilin-type N-terminal cleavage/methylation domain-containing protein
MKGNCGFTILEIIIVVITIGILSAIAVPRIIQGAAIARANRAAYTILLYNQAIKEALSNGITDASITNAVANGQEIFDTTILVGTNNDGMWTYTYAASVITATKNVNPQIGATITYNVNTSTWGGTHTPLPSS